MRKAEISRKTTETDVTVRLSLDGSGNYAVDTGLPFFDHMLELMCRHGGFDLEVKAAGDLGVDGHHTVEDIGICLGQVLSDALGDKKGINRYGHELVPMDDALVLVALDLSGRAFSSVKLDLPAERLGTFETELVDEFMRSFALQGKLNLHVRMLDGYNTHHIIEAVFKGLGRALRYAVAKDLGVRGIPSTKGIL
ncbi:MAG TPA: imidazoleglycerol-phosphate dehydratase HisB [Clostridia bacterium]|nr:imidazoleglycerol-phosphate dehydratase HisB [Clostridia bacterium]